MKANGLLVALGGALVMAAWLVGGLGAAFGGAVGLASQLSAVALLRPAMGAPQQIFFARWLGGMGIRALALGAVLVAVVARRDLFPALATTVGFLGVLLPLLFLETKFLR